MAKNVEHVSHIKSKLKTNGLPQLPTADKLVDGEIAINYAEGVETISIKNESGSIVTFSSDNYYTEKKLGSGFTNNDATVTEAIDDLEYMVVNKEEAIAAALNDLNGRKLDASAYTPTDLSNYYTKGETSGATEIQTAFNGKTDTATTTALNNVVTSHTANTNIHLTTTEKGQLHTHTNKTYLDGITGTVGTMAYENASSYSSATQVSTALSNKVDKTEYATFSATTNTSIEDLSRQSKTVASALNDLNDKKLDASAYTPTDLSNYYTKGETSGKTEIQTALSNKADKTAIDDLSRQIQTALNSKADKTTIDDLNRQIQTALNSKADKDDLSRQIKTIAAALNDLNARLSELSEKLK